MKKLLAILCLCMGFMACGDNKEQADTAKNENQKPHLVFATQEVGTGAYQYASAISNVFLKGLPEGSTIDLTTESPGGVGAPIVLENEQCDIIMSNAGPAKWSSTTGILGHEPTKNIRTLGGGLGHDFMNVLFTEDFVKKTGITTVEELVKQKYPVRLAIKKVGSLGEMVAEKLFAAYNVTLDDIKEWGGTVDLLGGDAIKIYIQDGKADMTIDHVAAGQANTTELCMTKQMYFPQISDEILEKLAADGFDYITIDANTWKGQVNPIKSVGSQQNILVNANMDEQTAYSLTKALCEGREELASQMASLSYFNPATAWKKSLAGVEVHPGALKYYKEQGYIK